jgi:sec-independent protein translocase protein TatC
MEKEQALPIVQHLGELRKVFIVSLAFFVCTTLICYFVLREQLFWLVTRPMQGLNLPLVYLGVTEGFFTHLRLSCLAGFIMALPVIMWQFWSFLVPALYPHEKKYVGILVPVSILLFIAGVSFGYFVVFPFIIRFLILVAGQGLDPMISVRQYVSFLISFLLPFGIIFELPLVVYFLTSLGLVTSDSLLRNRKYAILLIFVMAAVLTPGPDPISQSMMALPMVLLYQVSIWVAWLGRKRKVDD